MYKQVKWGLLNNKGVSLPYSYDVPTPLIDGGGSAYLIMQYPGV